MNLPTGDTLANGPEAGPYPGLSGGQKFIPFQLGGELFCVAAAGIFQVERPLQISALPDSPTWLLGLAAHRGEIVAVLDPRVAKPGSAAVGTGRMSKTLIFHSAPDHVRFALPVDRIEETLTFGTQHYLPAKTRSDGHLICEIEVDGRIINVIDHEHLLSSLNFREYA